MRWIFLPEPEVSLFELISRGCRNVTAIEKNNAHASFIAKVAKELKTDALALIVGMFSCYLNSAPKQSFGFIFAVPHMPCGVAGNTRLGFRA